MEDLKRKTIRSGLARVSSQSAVFVLRIVSMMILARLLDPADFGLVAMVIAVTTIYQLFATAGLSAATVQQQTISDQQISTLFWVNMLVGAILAVLCWLTAPLLASFYNEPRLLWIAITVALGFLFNAAGVQHSALLERQLRYGVVSLIEVMAQLTSMIVAIAMALAGLGYWALVAQAIIPSIVRSVGAWLSVRWIPGRPGRGYGVGSMLRFGGTITLNGLIVYLAYNAEKVLLGRFWGAEVLGIYGRAYQLINIPTENLNAAVGSVAFSALSRLHDDPQRFRTYFLKGYFLVNSLTIPTTCSCLLFADDIVRVLLGPKWVDAVPIFRLLAPTVLTFGMINPTAWLLLSTGRQNRSLKIALVIAPLVVGSYLVGLPYGAEGVAFCYSAAMMLWLVPHIVWSLHGTMVSVRDVFLALVKPLVSIAVAGAAASAAGAYVAQLDHPLLRLSLELGVMTAVYGVMLLFVMGQKALYLDLFNGLKSAPRAG